MKMNWKGTLLAVSVSLVLGGATAQSVVQVTDESGFVLTTPVVEVTTQPDPTTTTTVYLQASPYNPFTMQSMMPAPAAEAATEEGAAESDTSASGAAAAPAGEATAETSEETAAATAPQDMDISQMFRVVGVNGVYGLDVQIQNAFFTEDGRIGLELSANGRGSGTLPFEVIVENTMTGQQAILPLYAELSE